MFEDRVLKKISRVKGRLWQAHFRSDDDNILVQDFIIDCGNCNM